MTNNSQYSIFNIQQRPRREFANSSARKGFTLIETMVALTIVLVAVVGPISLIGNSLRNIYFARDQMVAVNLAQEGIEVVRWKRDSNLLVGAPTLWDSGLVDGPYIVDALSFSLATLAGDNKVYQDANGFYRQGVSGTATQFSRTVNISTPSGGGTHERTIASTVTWNTGNDTGTITVTEHLFDMPVL